MAYQSINPYNGKLLKTFKESRVDTGMVFINHPTWTAADLPFGGIKNSGYGRELSSLGIQEFVNKKLVRVASIDTPA
jgi:succinate-semialdehyde dehydrogenase/glutarate-semialdehyde dehydrogenase